MYRSGLVQRGTGGHPYDLFRGRLLFPIHNLQGKVVAFGGRALGEESPKYLNSPESAIFRKRKELFGLHLTKRFLSSGESRVLIVEGYFDFLRVYKSGFQNVVASLGTALTEDHVRVLKRFVQEAVVIFDGDKAGEAASLRGLEVFLEGEMGVRIVMLPEGYDPDSFLREKGPAEFQSLVEQGLDFFDFKWKMLTRLHSPSDSAGLLRISSEFLETFSKVKSPILLDRYLKRLAGLLGVGESSLRSKLAERERKVRARDVGPPSVSAPDPSLAVFPEEGTLISLLLEEPRFWEEGLEGLSLHDFRHPAAREAFEILSDSREGGNLTYSRAFNRLKNESIKSFITAHSMRELSREAKEKAFSDCVRKIKQKRLDERLEKLRRAIRDAEGGGEGGKVGPLLEEYRTLLEQKG